MFSKSVMAGFFISLGAFFMLKVGMVAPVEVRGLLMGLVFSLALVLIVFSSTNLFTGKCYADTFNYLTARDVSPKSVRLRLIDYFVYPFFVYWIGNFVGCMLGVTLFYYSAPEVNFLAFLETVSTTKVSYEISTLIVKAIFCNVLVCSAVWLSNSIENPAAKILIIVECVTAFVTSGYEHCIANMALLPLGALYDFISWKQVFYNMAYTTLGNMIGGILIGYFAFKQRKI